MKHFDFIVDFTVTDITGAATLFKFVPNAVTMIPPLKIIHQSTAGTICKP